MLQVLGNVNGFDLAAALVAREAAELPVPTGFRYRALVTMVSEHAQALRGHATRGNQFGDDGSINGCDLLLPKPLTLDVVRTLIEGCGI